MPKLFMIKIGGRPKGRLIEQHDMYFGVGEHIGDFIDSINAHWPEVKNKWHLDAYRQVTKVDNYRINWQPITKGNEIAAMDTDTADTISDRGESTKKDENAATLKLFFINLGGYIASEFEEYHHKLLIVAPTQADAIRQAKKSAFYQQYSFNDKTSLFNAASHIDDKQQVDVDEIYDVNDLLSAGRLRITALIKDELASDLLLEDSAPEDEAHIGYLSLKKLRKLSEDKQV